MRSGDSALVSNAKWQNKQRKLLLCIKLKLLRSQIADNSILNGQVLYRGLIDSIWNVCLITFPKLPLPNTVKKWKSSTEYFLKRGIDVAGAVIVPDRWNCAYVYDVSVDT